MKFCGQSNIGRLRGNNEDCFHIPRKDDALQNVFIVADGMGGESAGEIASALAISGAYTKIKKEYSPRTDMSLLLRRAVTEANKVVLSAATADSRCKNMGTTMTLAITSEDSVYVANVGDSRAYLFSDKLTQITHDHSLVQEMIDKGLITNAEASVHPNRNLITRAVGAQRFIDVDIFAVPWKKGDMLLLATDGLTGMISENDIAAAFAQNHSCTDASKALIEKALAAGGKDNITVICVENNGGPSDD